MICPIITVWEVVTNPSTDDTPSTLARCLRGDCALRENQLERYSLAVPGFVAACRYFRDPEGRER